MLAAETIIIIHHHKWQNGVMCADQKYSTIMIGIHMWSLTFSGIRSVLVWHRSAGWSAVSASYSSFSLCVCVNTCLLCCAYQRIPFMLPIKKTCFYFRIIWHLLIYIYHSCVSQRRRFVFVFCWFIEMQNYHPLNLFFSNLILDFWIRHNF